MRALDNSKVEVKTDNERRKNTYTDEEVTMLMQTHEGRKLLTVPIVSRNSFYPEYLVADKGIRCSTTLGVKGKERQ